MIAVLEALAKDGKVVLLQHFRVDDAHDTKRTLAYSDEVNPMSEASVKSLEEGTEKSRACDVQGELGCEPVTVVVDGKRVEASRLRPNLQSPWGTVETTDGQTIAGKVALTKDTYGPLVSTWDEACFPENTMVANEEELMNEVDEDLTEVKNDLTSSATNTNGASTALADDDNSNEASTTSSSCLGTCSGSKTWSRRPTRTNPIEKKKEFHFFSYLLQQDRSSETAGVYDAHTPSGTLSSSTALPRPRTMPPRERPSSRRREGSE